MQRRTVRVAALVVALVLASFSPRLASGAYPVNTWGEAQSFTIYNDTLAHTANDSVSTTAGFPTYGARYILLVATSTTNDSLLAPILQTRLPGGTWTGKGGAANQPFSGINALTTQFTATTVVGQAGGAMWCADSEPTIAGSYGIGVFNDSLRFRLKGNTAMVRQYANTANNPALGSTGRVTVRAFVWY